MDANDAMEVDETDVDSLLLQQFSCMGTTDRHVLISQFHELVGNGSNDPDAVFYLETNNRCTASNRLSTLRRCMSAEAATLSTPLADGQDKVYPEHVERLVQQISRMTLLEVAELNECLKKRLNIADAPMVMAGPAAATPALAEEEEGEQQVSQKVQTSFTVKLNAFDAAKKVPLIKELKACVEGMNLVQAKKFVESAPAVVKADIPKDEAERLKELLEKAGAVCVVE